MEISQEEIQQAREKLKQKMGEEGAKVGGKGTKRRVKKVHHQTQITDVTKLKQITKKFGVQPLPGIEEVNLFQDDGSVIHFTHPEMMASLQSNTFVVMGKSEQKSLKELMPEVLTQLGPKQFSFLQEYFNLNKGEKKGEVEKIEEQNEEEDVPELVGQNFEEASKKVD
eukprot:TRINITY_DN275_c0_g2_i1.p1 TRINITY_DN275_c0_g2~~TRINITY_DN275_c0_g2_i1.p1  ORF type:complete len:168 (+),score=44.04 TRINITY_DN275_c0_g2_i1:234-737(+)